MIGTSGDFIAADILVAGFLVLITLESGLISDLEMHETSRDCVHLASAAFRESWRKRGEFSRVWIRKSCYEIDTRIS